MSAFLYDLRSAFRSLTRHPGTSLAVILTLALGMGASTAIFSVIRGVLLRPLSFPQSEELMAVVSRFDGGNATELSWLNYVDLAEASHFENASLFSRSGMFIFGEEPRLIYGADVTASMFPLLGVQPLMGRVFTEDEDRRNAPKVAVISYELWRSAFASDPNIVGRGMRVSAAGDTRTILGVMPPGFRFPVSGEVTDFWTPLAESLTDEDLQHRDRIWMSMVARLRDGVKPEEAQLELEVIADRLSKKYPASNRGLRFAAVPLREWIVQDVRPALWVLLGGVGLVILIACANIANLLLGRAIGRMRELAVRSALGAARWRIARQILIESIVLGLAAGLAGLLIGKGSLGLLIRLAGEDVPRLDAVAMDSMVFGFALAISVGTGILFGLAPALAVMRLNILGSLREGGNRGATEGRRANALRRSLVVAEIALSLLLLFSAGLLLRSFSRLVNIDPGFDAENAVVVDISARTAYETDVQTQDFFRRLRERLRAVPGVTDVTAARILPFHYTNMAFDYRVEGRAFDPAVPLDGASYAVVLPGYFGTLKMRMLRGRDFLESDDAGSVPVVVISESLARREFPNSDPIGQRMVINAGAATRTIVGVVSDIREAERTRPVSPTMYVSNTQSPQRRLRTIVKTTMPKAAIEPELRRVVRQLDPLQPIVDIESFEEVQSYALARRRLALTLVAVLAVLAFLLAAVGIYSVMAYMVAQRRSEIAVRMALGARPADIARMILSQTTLMFLTGSLIGILAAIATRKLLQSFLVGITPTDPITFASILLLLGLATFLAGWLPARRAASVEPLSALRPE